MALLLTGDLTTSYLLEKKSKVRLSLVARPIGSNVIKIHGKKGARAPLACTVLTKATSKLLKWLYTA